VCFAQSRPLTFTLPLSRLREREGPAERRMAAGGGRVREYLTFALPSADIAARAVSREGPLLRATLTLPTLGPQAGQALGPSLSRKRERGKFFRANSPRSGTWPGLIVR